MQHRLACAALIAALTAASDMSGAQAVQDGDSRWRIGAALGYGQRSNPLVQSDDVPIAVDLDIAWFGDRWFFDNGDLGLTVADNARLTASIVARVNSDRLFFSRTNTRLLRVGTAAADGTLLSAPAQFTPPDRDYAVELGVELLTDGRWGALQLGAFHDASNTHDGYEVFADYSYRWRRQRVSFVPSFGASYKSARLNDYYWGVTAAEAGLAVLPYSAGAGMNWHARLQLGYQINRNWAMTLAAEYERLNDTISDSPIVKDRGVSGFFAGMAWSF